MSRICVKNLPKYVTEDRLRDVFSQKGEITDVKLKRFRQFAYIGFRNEQEAQEAITYFNKSFIDTLRIIVEVAKVPPRTSHSLQKEGKVSEKSSNPYAKGDKMIKKKPDQADDPELQEFLEDKLKFWSNDMCIPRSTGKEKVSPVVSSGAEPNKAKRISLDTKKSIQNDVVALGDDVSDMEYFKSRINQNLSDSDSDDDADLALNDDGDIHVFPIDGDKDNDDDAMEVEEAHCNMAQALKSDSDAGRLFVRNLPYTTTEEELMEHFSKFGEISEAHLVLDKETKRSRGFAYILYQIPESAARAMEELDYSIFQGRLLHILPAKHRETSDKQVKYASNLPKTFKQKREEQRKASEASGNTKAWNCLFMRPDTILENMVRVYGVKKSELLDRESKDPAVFLALGETKVIMETQ